MIIRSADTFSSAELRRWDTIWLGNRQ